MKRFYTALITLLSIAFATTMHAQDATTQRAAATEAEIGNIVVFLNTAEWGQSTPYNKLCFTSGGKQALTGCVPTAYAILMHHHKWPACANEKKVYHSGTGESIVLGHEYDWGNMLSSYRGGYNDKQATAVATLMRDLGYAYQVAYGTGSTDSGAGGEGAGKLLEIFKYKSESPNTSSATMATNRDVLANDKLWVQYIKESLDAGCPIPYSSSTTGGGRHIFILDGYTDNGYFHFNWGWGGNGNGWFKLDDMTPDATSNYSKSHRAYFMLKPDRAETEQPDTPVAEYTINTAVNIPEGGTATVNGNSEATVEEGTVITLSATANDGYTFVNWTVDGVEASTRPVFTTTAQKDATYTANFKSTAETVIIKLYGSGGYRYINDNTSGKYEANVGSLVTLRTESVDNTFAFFTLEATYKNGGKIVTNKNPYQFIATEDATFYINYIGFGIDASTELNVPITAVATAGGKASVNNYQSRTLPLGEEITLRAVADSGYGFTGWSDSSGNIISLDATHTRIVEGAMTYTANFAQVETGISDTREEKKGIIYDLCGRRVEKATRPGIYIVDGKKILIR